VKPLINTVLPAQKNARQPLLAERKLPTTDNKDEMRFEKSLKKNAGRVQRRRRFKAALAVESTCARRPASFGTAWHKGFRRGVIRHPDQRVEGDVVRPE
jgi:hypothetical protein